jgi:hypothetical protein
VTVAAATTAVATVAVAMAAAKPAVAVLTTAAATDVAVTTAVAMAAVVVATPATLLTLLQKLLQSHQRLLPIQVLGSLSLARWLAPALFANRGH